MRDILKLNSRFEYNALTGKLINRSNGKEAGWNKSGYRYVKVDGEEIPVHRLAVALVTGQWASTYSIDHKNGNKLDNRFSNLRPATVSQNNHNVGLSTRNSSGYKGVSRHYDKWQAQLTVNGKRFCLGTYDDPITAAKVRDEFALQQLGEYAWLNAVPSNA